MVSLLRPNTVFCCVLLFLLISCPAIVRAKDLEVVQRWLATNTGVRSIRIDFTQTRTLRAIKLPLKQDGSLWLDYENQRFRWQLGDPPQTIVVKPDKDLIIIRTSGKKYEKRAPGEGQTPAMAALANGFPRTLEAFQSNYRVLKIESRDNTYRIVAAPLGASARGVDSFTYVVQSDSFRLVGIEISLKDGSNVKTVFNRVQPNVPLLHELFQPSLEGYRETKF